MPTPPIPNNLEPNVEAVDRTIHTSHGAPSGKKGSGPSTWSDAGTTPKAFAADQTTTLSGFAIEDSSKDDPFIQSEQCKSSIAVGVRSSAETANAYPRDWHSSLKTNREASGFDYELQGELLRQVDAGPPLKNDFSIPYALQGFPSGGSATTRTASHRPPRQSTATTGGRRKSTSGRLSAMASESATSDTMEEPRRASEVSLGDSPSARARRTFEDLELSMLLPARKVFPIQIGNKLFRLSGASLSSDAPSYFTQFFEQQLRLTTGAEDIRTLYIDRDPETFTDIALHLQGYHIEPRDGPHFVKLFADAQFFDLPRLTGQLFSSPIYIRIGDEEFQIPRDLFNSPGNSPNYFSLGFSTFFSAPSEANPGLSQRSSVRPPSILPPSISHRSAKTFADLVHILKGYPVDIRNDEHREELLRDARYFGLKGLEQRLIPHDISYSLARERSEIVLRLEDIQRSGISFVSDNASVATPSASSPASSTMSETPSGAGWIYYQRPYVDTTACCLIVEMASEDNTFLTLQPASRSGAVRIGQAKFFKQTLAKVISLFSIIAAKTHQRTTASLGTLSLRRSASITSIASSPRTTEVIDTRVKCRIGPDADVVLNGQPWTGGDANNEAATVMDIDPSAPSRAGSKRKKQDEEEEDVEEWIVRRGQWRLRLQPIPPQDGRSGMEIVLGAVKLEAYSTERGRNAMRTFL